MAVPAFRAAGTTALFTASTTVRAQYPTLALNDILFWVAIASNSSAGMGISWPAGWTSLLEGENTDDCHCFIAWRRADGTETGNVDATLTANGDGVTTIVSFKGAKRTSTPWEGYSLNFGTSTAVVSNAIVTTDADRLGVHLVLPRSNVGTSPTGSWTEHVDSGGNVARNVVESITIATASTEASTTRTFGTSRDFFTLALALLPDLVEPQGEGDAEGEVATATLLEGLTGDVLAEGDAEGEVASTTLIGGMVEPWANGDAEGEVASAILNSMIFVEAAGDSEGEVASISEGYAGPRMATMIGEQALLVRIGTPARNVTMSSSIPPVIQ